MGEPNTASNIQPRLGGMHLLMSYCGSVGTLLVRTGIQEILTTAFVGALKMLTGKKYQQNVRAFRMLVEELLRPIFAKHHPEALEALDDIAAQSRTSKLWVYCLIKSVFSRSHEQNENLNGLYM